MNMTWWATSIHTFRAALRELNREPGPEHTRQGTALDLWKSFMQLRVCDRQELNLEFEYTYRMLLKSDYWVYANGGLERPFFRSGKRVVYVWNPATGRHGYLNLDTDVVEEDEPYPETFPEERNTKTQAQLAIDGWDDPNEDIYQWAARRGLTVRAAKSNVEKSLEGSHVAVDRLGVVRFRAKTRDKMEDRLYAVRRRERAARKAMYPNMCRK